MKKKMYTHTNTFGINNIDEKRGKRSLPSSSLRVRLAISLISMRDSDSECVAETRGAAHATAAGAAVAAVNTLLTSGDLRGLSMLRPTRLHKGILKMCLHADSPGKEAADELDSFST